MSTPVNTFVKIVKTSIAYMKNGDTKSLERIYQRYHAKLYFKVLKYSQSIYLSKETVQLPQVLIENGLKQNTRSEDVVIAGGAIYLKDHNPNLLKR